MPGLTILADPHARAATAEHVLGALAEARHFPDYRVEVLFRSPHLLVAASRYPEYPIATWDAGRFVVVLEGRVYGVPRDTLPRGLVPDAERARRWLMDADGDFVAVIIDRETERALVLNDRYGRLPLYHGRHADAVLASRELGCLAGGLARARVRPEGVAEFLLFGYPLGAGTLFHDVARLPPASLLSLP